jgi:hypothetical protein
LQSATESVDEVVEENIEVVEETVSGLKKHQKKLLIALQLWLKK